LNSSYDQPYLNREVKTSLLRKLLCSHLYLARTLSYVKGATIDFGRGAGLLLARLPQGSIGLEINEASVRYCRDAGLDVRLYDPAADNYTFRTLNLEYGKYGTLVMSHVLEHLEDPNGAFRRILSSCSALGIERVILVVPGLKGFRSDGIRHKTFVDEEYLTEHSLWKVATYSVTKKEYFPFPCSWAGRHFTYNELRVIWDREAETSS